MGLILKNWAKQWDITREESLSSYALILMMVYFLQLKGILPSLQRIAKEKRAKNAEKPLIRIKRTVKDNKTEEFLTDLTFETDLKVKNPFNLIIIIIIIIIPFNNLNKTGYKSLHEREKLP